MVRKLNNSRKRIEQLPRTSKPDLGDKTLDRALDLFTERRKAAGSPPNAKERGYATGFSRHLIYAAPLSTVRTPQDIRDAVYAAVTDACRETGYKLPHPKKRGSRKKR